MELLVGLFLAVRRQTRLKMATHAQSGQQPSPTPTPIPIPVPTDSTDYIQYGVCSVDFFVAFIAAVVSSGGGSAVNT